MVLLGTFALTLDELIKGALFRILEPLRQLHGGVSRPVRRELFGGDGSQLALEVGRHGHGDEQVEARVLMDAIEERGAKVLGVGQNQGARLARRVAGRTAGREDFGRQLQQLRGGLRDGAGRGAGQESDGLAGVGIEGEEGLGHVDGASLAVLFVPAHLTFAVAVQAVRVDDEDASAKVVAGATELAEGDLQLMGVGDGMTVEEEVDGDIGGDKGKSIGQFEAALPQAASFADAGDAEGGFVDQLQGESRFDAGAGASGPAAEEIPSAEAEMFGDEQP